MKITLQSPSNIALVKYMGKKNEDGNLPENASLSMTLDSLCTVVQIENEFESGAFKIRFSDDAPIGDFADLPSFFPKKFSDGDRERYLRHFERVISRAESLFFEAGLASIYQAPRGAFILRSANTFPAGSGIASSASSFSALTLAALALSARSQPDFEAHFSASTALKHAVAALSREGSGSSCRSLEGPFVMWNDERAEAVPSAFEPLYDYVILVSSEAKGVSSSEAHRRVKSSPLWVGRINRANSRCAEVRKAITSGDWNRVCRLAAEDSYEMHSLFHTSDPPFMYWMPETVRWLKLLAGREEFLVTLDAGPNLHVLVRERDRATFERFFEEQSSGSRYLVDRQGKGARFR